MVEIDKTISNMTMSSMLRYLVQPTIKPQEKTESGPQKADAKSEKSAEEDISPVPEQSQNSTDRLMEDEMKDDFDRVEKEQPKAKQPKKKPKQKRKTSASSRSNSSRIRMGGSNNSSEIDDQLEEDLIMQKEINYEFSELSHNEAKPNKKLATPVSTKSRPQPMKSKSPTPNKSTSKSK